MGPTNKGGELQDDWNGNDYSQMMTSERDFDEPDCLASSKTSEMNDPSRGVSIRTDKIKIRSSAVLGRGCWNVQVVAQRSPEVRGRALSKIDKVLMKAKGKQRIRIQITS